MDNTEWEEALKTIANIECNIQTATLNLKSCMPIRPTSPQHSKAKSTLSLLPINHDEVKVTAITLKSCILSTSPHHLKNKSTIPKVMKTLPNESIDSDTSFLTP
jgi:hypothetical protein